MPSHEEHKKITRIITGKDYDWIHKMMDFAVPYLGPRHRIVGHDQETVALAFVLSGGDLGAAIAAEAHILVDKQDTFIKKSITQLLGRKKTNKRRRRRVW